MTGNERFVAPLQPGLLTNGELSIGDIIQDLDSRHRLPPERLALMIVGSTAQGWANETSDIDINVVAVHPWHGAQGVIGVPLEPDTVPVEVQQVQGQRCEIRYWLDRQVDQMMAHVGWPAFEMPSPTTTVLHVLEESFLERLVSCICVDGEDWVRQRQGELARSAFKALIVARSLSESDNCCEDALGQLASNDTHSAVLSARQALGHSIDALLESGGTYGSHNSKWRSPEIPGWSANPREL